jgi:adenylate cyclase
LRRKETQSEGRSPRKLLQGLAVGAAAGLIALALELPGWLSGFEEKTWDPRVRLLARPALTTPQVALILLDQQSLDWGSKENGLSWPWPREVYSYVIDFCRRAGAKAVAFDVLFTEPSVYGVEDDAALASAAAGYGRFVAAVFPGEQGSAERWPDAVPPSQLVVEGLDRWIASERPADFAFARAAFPFEGLASGARVLANVNFQPDDDGVFRRAALLSVFDGKALPSLALGAYLAAAEGPTEVSIRPGVLTIDGRRIPIDGDGRAILRYRFREATHEAYSAAAVIQSDLQLQARDKPSVDPELLRGRYVLFGFSAPGLKDLRPSPVAGNAPGVEINATMLDNILAADFAADASPALAIAATLVVALAAGMAAALASGAAQNILAYAIFLPLPFALAVGAYPLRIWLPLVGPELAVVLTLVSDNLLNYVTEGRQKRYIKGAFKQYLSPAVIEQLIAHPERLKLGGERRELSIFFSDLQGFTGISEGLSPEELTALLNEYLTAMTDIIQDEGGTIDKYEGDAIIAFWNAPIEQPDHAVRAVRAALRCQAKLAEMRPGLKARVGKELWKRIGLNSGPAVVGNMGSHTRFDYTMLGDAVNLASRLEGINKQFGTYTMMSKATRDLAGDAFAARELSRVAVVGRTEPVTVYEPLLPEQAAARRALLAAFAEALDAYYAGDFARAEGRFAALAAEDPPAGRYAARCRELRAAPPSPWQGVWVMTEK